MISISFERSLPFTHSTTYSLRNLLSKLSASLNFANIDLRQLLEDHDHISFSVLIPNWEHLRGVRTQRQAVECRRIYGAVGSVNSLNTSHRDGSLFALFTSSWFCCCDHCSFFTSGNTQLGVTSTMTHRTFWLSLKSSLIVVSEAFFSALRRNIALHFCLSLKYLSSSFLNGQFLLCFFFFLLDGVPTLTYHSARGYH